MRTAKLIAILSLSLAPIAARGQIANIEIDHRVFENAVNSLLLVSDPNGELVYEKEINAPAFNENFKFSFFQGAYAGSYNFTVYNEYECKGANIGARYFRASTFCHVSDGLLVKHLEDFEVDQSPTFEALSITIHGIEAFNDFGNVSTPPYSKKDQREIARKGKFEFPYKHDTKLDLYLVVKCNNESRYRYIYLPKEEVKKENHFDWHALGQDLRYQQIVLPHKEKWYCSVEATNEDFQSRSKLCRYYLGKPDSKATVFFPEKHLFYDYEFVAFYPKEAGKTQEGFFHIYKGDKLPETVPKLGETSFEYRLDAVAGKGFRLSTYEEDSLRFNLKYKGVSFEPFQTGFNNRALQYSTWTVRGTLHNELNFVFPKIPSYYKPSFNTIEDVAKEAITPARIAIRKTLNENEQQLMTKILED